MKEFLVIVLLSCVSFGGCFITQTNRTLLPTQYSSGQLIVTASLSKSPNELIVGGWFSMIVTIGSSNFSSNGTSDMFLASIDRSTNQYQWIKVIGGAGYERLFAFTIDSNGDYVISGSLYGSSDFGGGTVSAALANSANIVLIKLGADRTFKWSKVYGTNLNDEASSIATDFNNNIIIAGFHYSTTSWGGGNLASFGNNDWGIGKYNSSGHHMWSQSFGGPTEDHASGVAVLSNGNIVAVGSFEVSVTVNGTSIPCVGREDALMIVFNPNGTIVSYQTFGTSVQEHAYGVDVDSFNNIYVTGISSSYAYLNKYNPNLTLLWSKGWNSGGVYGFVTVGSDNSIFVCGQYFGSFVIDGITVPPSDSNGGAYAFNFNSTGSAMWGVGFTNGYVTAVLGSTFATTLDYAVLINYGSGLTDLNGNICPDNSASDRSAVVAFLSDVSPSPTPSVTPSRTPSVTPSTSTTPSVTPSTSTTPSVTPSTSTTPSVTPSASVTPSLSKTPSTSKTPGSDSESSGGDDLPLEIIIPVVIGGSCCIAAGIVGGVFIKRRKDKQKLEMEMS